MSNAKNLGKIWEKKNHLGQRSPIGTMSNAKNLEISQFSVKGKWLLLWIF